MAKESVFIYIGMLILLISMVSAVPPFETQVAGGTDRIEIEVPIVDFIEQGIKGVTLHTHIFNGTTDKMLIPSATSIGCYLHLYNSTGQHTLQEEMIPDDNDLEWQLDIGKDNFSVIGVHSFLIWCNNSNNGGFVRGGFDVTATGTAEDITNAHFAIIIVVIFVIIFYLILTGKFALEVFTDHAFLKLLFLITSMWFLLFPLNIALQFAEFREIPASIPGQLELMIQIIIFINVLITFYFIIWFSVEILKKLLFIKHQRKTDQDRL